MAMSETSTTVQDRDETTTQYDDEVLARLDALSANVRSVEDDQMEMERRHEADLDELREELAKVREENAELKRRTDLLSLTEQADDLGAKQKSAILLQNLHRKALQKQERGKRPHASITRSQAEDILQNINQDRTTFYSDMERAARLVGEDNDVVRYDTTGQESTLKMNLEKGDLPGSADGVTLHADTNGGR